MDKNSTQPILSFSLQNSATKPKRQTIAKIKQFARVYAYVSTTKSALGNMVLN